MTRSPFITRSQGSPASTFRRSCRNKLRSDGAMSDASKSSASWVPQGRGRRPWRDRAVRCTPLRAAGARLRTPSTMVSPVPTNNTRLCGLIKSSSRHRQGSFTTRRSSMSSAPGSIRGGRLPIARTTASAWMAAPRSRSTCQRFSSRVSPQTPTRTRITRPSARKGSISASRYSPYSWRGTKSAATTGGSIPRWFSQCRKPPESSVAAPMLPAGTFSTCRWSQLA